MREIPELALFPRLSTKLRLKIWHAYFDNPPFSPASFCMITTVGTDRSPFSISRPAALPLLETCRESRQVALEHSFNPAADVLYLGNDGLEPWSDEFMHCQELSPQIQHLAIAMAHCDHPSAALFYALQWLSGLKTISVVFPRASGHFNYRAAVPYPPTTTVTTWTRANHRSRSSSEVLLRKLLPAEENAIRVSADYQINDWYMDNVPADKREEFCRVRWSRTGTEFVEAVREMISLQIHSLGHHIKVPPPWFDETTMELNLNIDSMCLEMANWHTEVGTSEEVGSVFSAMFPALKGSF
ncbi:hypothetical protein BX600DRAFT_504442 [Xylariales sp. PMI_506]|nr:hypothetical protein BX600DRAFT_504442 [Xylariales sp. PMI_506]